MTLDSRGYVSIAELVVYVPAFVLAIIICVRHGIRQTSGWIYTLILCLVRIVGSVCQLVTYSNPSVGLIQAYLVFDSVGLSPLLFATLGLLSRLVDWINTERGPILQATHFRLVQLIITVGLILGIVGGVQQGSSQSTTGTSPQPSSVSQAAIILYIVAFAALVGILLLSFGYLSYVPSKEQSISAGVAIALPLILVRLVYSALSTFTHSKTFSILGGNVGVFVGMAVVEEFLVIIIYLGLGFIVPKLQKGQQGEVGNGQWRQRRERPIKFTSLRGANLA
ncbi:unnamed protein product [Clonostachys chloroleuca]|uniref:DUF7702 domain-containing protein n=1 Tax=Clonostachys chloroleuca TaxID=1926264 RepID=A0AA35Q6X9_9HYPO|nr:unnamed protein product [Clonostachys chloroleuca]